MEYVREIHSLVSRINKSNIRDSALLLRKLDAYIKFSLHSRSIHDPARSSRSGMIRVPAYIVLIMAVCALDSVGLVKNLVTCYSLDIRSERYLLREVKVNERY